MVAEVGQEGDEAGDVMTGAVLVRNSGDSDMEFWIEPWGDGHVTKPGRSVRVEFDAAEDLRLLVDAAPGRVVLWVEGGSPREQPDRRLFAVEGS